MEANNAEDLMDPARVALLFGVSVGLGIVLHEGFFVVAGAIAVGAMAATVANLIYDHTEQSGLTHRHR
jgi:hypothetical protein